MSALVKELTINELPALERHFLLLGAEDRRLRFGYSVNDDAVRNYVRNIDFDRDAVFGVADDHLELIAAGHLARASDDRGETAQAAELGVSVLSGHRGKGLGGAVLRRAHMHARNWGSPKLFMHCLSENSTMMHLARQQGMAIISQSGESDAWLELPPADSASLMGEVFEQRVALFDYELKAQIDSARRATAAMQAALTKDRRK